MRHAVVALSFALSASACATGGVGPARTYVRQNVENVRLKTIDVVVVASEIQAAGPQLNVPTFDPPTRDAILGIATEDDTTRNALIQTLRTKLRSQGFAVRFVHVGASEAPAAEAPEEPGSARTSTVALPPTDTSTAIGPGAPRVTPAPPAPPPAPTNDDRPLPPGTTLATVFAESEADGVLVVRVVPVDAFYVLKQNNEQSDQLLDPTAGQARIVPGDTPVPRSGRLMFGQAFLFDRETGLRLWTKNLPDYPDSGTLAASSPFLEYGFVTPDGEGEKTPAVKADLASEAFVTKIFGDFPLAREGSDAGRAMLAEIDPEAEAQQQAFLDEGWVGLGVDLGWTAESAGADISLNGDVVDQLGTGALAPSGVFRAVPRLNVVSPGGFSFTVAVPIGFGPGSFGRTYHQDNPMPTLMDDTDRGTRATISGPTTVGVEVGAGYLLSLTPTISLLPGLSLFGDAWFLDTSPAVEDDVHLRFGVLGRVDAIVRPSATGSLFLRVGGDFRLGVDVAGPAVVGGGLTAGVGLFL